MSRPKELRAYMDAVASLGCLACRMEGRPGVPAQLHHPRGKVGLGQRGSDLEVIPICAAHHTGLGQKRGFPSIHMNPRAFRVTYGTEEVLSRMAREMTGWHDEQVLTS